MSNRFRSGLTVLVAAVLCLSLVGPISGSSVTGSSEPAWDAATGRLDPAAFREPPGTSRPHAFWFWNGELTEEELLRQLEEMKANGVEEFFIHPRQGLGGEFGKTENEYYLSKDFFDKVGFTLRAADSRGMKAWLYDDLNWPSGYAGGRTVRGGVVDGREIPADPDFVPWYLTPVAGDVSGGTTYDEAIPLTSSPGFSVVDGEIVINGGEVTGFANAGADWTDYRVEFDVTVDSIAAGWTVRSQDNGEHVMVNLTSTSPHNPEAASSFGVHVKIDGAYRLLGGRLPAGVTIRNGERHRVATEVSGENVTVYLDGRKIGVRSDPAVAGLAHGRVGFREGTDESARFDNIAVTSLSDGSTLLSDDFSDGLAKWDVTPMPRPELVASVALRKSQPGSCTTGGQARGVGLDGRSTVDLTGRVEDGRLRWDVPPGEWCLLHLLQRPLVNYHPDLEPDEPYVDMLNPAVTEKFIDITHETYFKRFGDHFGSTIQGIFNDEPGFYNNFPDNRGGLDSLGSIPWTPGFRSYLRDNAGYDLTKQLAALWYDVGANTTKSRVDYYDALSDRYNEAHTEPLATWAAEHDIALISNPLVEEDLGSHRLIAGGSWFEMSKNYQLPGMDLISGLNTSAITPKLNSSVAHLFGRKRNLAETFGAFGWDLTMEEMKRTVAWEAAGGVDLIDNHAFYYSIDGDRAFESPPSEFFQNLFWPRFRHYAQLVGRLTEPARGAAPVNPVGVLYPSSSVMATGTPWDVRGFAGNGEKLGPVDASWKNTSNDLLAAQLDFDYLDELALAGDEDLGVDLRVEKGELALREQRWQALVVPRTTVLSLEAVETMERLVATGGTVVAVEGLATREAQGRDAELRQRLTDLFGTDPADAKESHQRHEDGLAAFLPTHAGLTKLVQERVTPGVALAPAAPDVRVRHVKRGPDDAFLVVNLAGHEVRTTAEFDVGQTPELWDPETGTQRVAPVFERDGEKTSVPLNLEPYEALWVMFRPGAHPHGKSAHLTATNAAVDSVAVDGANLHTTLVANGPGEVYAKGHYRGRSYGGVATVEDSLEPLPLDGSWTFRFDRDGAEPVTRPLGSWTDLDPRYSGSGTYTRTFTVPDGFLGPGRRVQLDLGAVRELGKVVVNGSEPMLLDWAPYTVDVTEQLLPGQNTISVTVTNTQANSIEGRAAPSGLLGPVVLKPQRVVRLALTPGTEVTSLDLSVSPAVSVVTPGRTATFTVAVEGIAPDELTATLHTTAPEGWSVDPMETAVSIPSDGRAVNTTVDVAVTPPPNAPEGSGAVTFTLTGTDGRVIERTAQLRVAHSFAAWEFDTEDDTQGWSAANQVTPLTVSDGALRFSSTGADPFVIGPEISVPLDSGTTIEVVISSSASGGGQLFWATTEGGFAESRSAKFMVEAGGVRTYRLSVPAQAADLTRLRLDPLSGTGDLVVDAIRVLPS